MRYSRGHVPQLAVDFGRWRTEDQVAYGPASQLDVLVASQNVDFRIGEDHPSLGHVFYCEFSAAALSSKSSNRSTHVVAFQCLDIFHFEAFDEKVVQPEQG